jgi:hypothetical protein
MPAATPPKPAETEQNAELEKKSSIQSTAAPQPPNIPSEPGAKETSQVPEGPTANSLAGADATRSSQDASADPMEKAPEARVEENVAAPNAEPVNSPTGEPSESSFQTLAPMPRIKQQRFNTPIDDFSMRSLHQEQPLSANPDVSTSRSSTLSELDTSVAQPAPKVERRDTSLNGQRLLATPATTPGGLQSGSNGGGMDLQTSIVLALTVAGGLVIGGVFWRTVLIDRAVRRESLARQSDEMPDPYDDPEFYRKLREGNFAQSS